GIPPWKELLARSRDRRKERFPIWGDMVPTNFLFFRSKPMTLWCLLLQVTPTQWQKWKESFQEARTLSGLSMWDLNSSSVSLSVSFESVERNRRKMAW
ncbi:hypothetical protein ACB092_08G034600, partial [Castanea dentata]